MHPTPAHHEASQSQLSPGFSILQFEKVVPEIYAALC